jgi:3-oxoacyl-[acyl-carrier protein] reductase
MMPDKRLAIVTGGAGGIGLVIANVMADAGFNVVVFDISKERLASLHGTRLVGTPVDVTNEAEVVTAVEEITNHFGAIHVLVNNAGTIYNEPFINIINREHPRHDFMTFKQNIEINLNAVFLMGSVVAEKMVLKRTPGVIVNISSISALGNAGQTAYSAAKAGVEAMTRVWSKELGVFGIRVAGVAPGFIDTESTRKALSEQKLREICGRTPLRRLGKEINVAKVVLAIIENDFINGVIIPVNGGMVL